jgi:hypothetical protein
MGVEKIPCCHWGESQTVQHIVSHSTNYAILAANSVFCPALSCAYIKSDTPDVMLSFLFLETFTLKKY